MDTLTHEELFAIIDEKKEIIMDNIIKDELKKVTKKAGTALDDDKLEQVAGGNLGTKSYCVCETPVPGYRLICKNCGRRVINGKYFTVN